MDNTVISVNNLHKSYFIEKREIRVLKGIDLEFKSGEITAIVGRSGAGKTTLLNLLGALDKPTDGDIAFRGKAYSKMSEPEFARFRNRNVGFVFQFHNLLNEFTALENVMMPLLINRISKDEVIERSVKILKELELSNRLDHKPSELSGGEQQRVAVARAIVNHPEIVLADEPSGNLDQKTGELLTDLLWNITRRKGHIFIIVTHNRELARKADRIIELRDGVIL